MPEPYLGEYGLIGFSYAPRGWTFCEGQLLPIAQNSDLFSLLGTIYGGDGRTTFALPDLRGRTPIGAGQGPGLPDVRLGQQQGGGALNVKVDSSGGGQDIENGQASLGLRYVIALQGIYPPRE